MKKRFLVTSILMLLLTVFALSTSTYAWFSMNREVTVTGLKVEAKTDSYYLMIGSGDNDTAPEIQALTGSQPLSTALSVTDTESQLYPAAHDAIATATDAATVGNWYTAAAQDHGAATIDNDTKTALTAENFAKFVIKRTVYLTVSAGSVNTGDIKATLSRTAYSTAEGKTMDGVSIVLACDGVVLEFNEANSWTNATAITTGVSASGVKTIDIYVYYDGNNADVYSDNFAKLTGATIGLTFTAVTE